MKLTEAQLQRVQQFMNTENLQYEEVKQELFDHLIAVIEDELDKNIDRPFEETIYAAYHSFGKGFRYIEAEYEKQIEQQVNQSSWKYLYRQFIEPKYLVRSMLLFGLCYGVVHFGLKMPYYLYGGFTALLVITTFYVGWLRRKLEKRYKDFVRSKITIQQTWWGTFISLYLIGYQLYVEPLISLNQEAPHTGFSESFTILATWLMMVILLAMIELLHETRKILEKDYAV